MLVHYADLILVGTVLLAQLVLRRRWVGLLYMVGTLTVVYVLTSLFHPGLVHDRYREQVNFVFAACLLIACGLLFEVPSWKPLLLMLSLCICYRIGLACMVQPQYAARTEWLRKHIAAAQRLGVRKGVVDTRGVEFGDANDPVDLIWSTPTESMLLSASEGADRTVSLITLDDVGFEDVREHLDQYVFRRWEIYGPGYLDPRYFQLPAGRYVPIDEGARTRMEALGLIPGLHTDAGKPDIQGK